MNSSPTRKDILKRNFVNEIFELKQKNSACSSILPVHVKEFTENEYLPNILITKFLRVFTIFVSWKKPIERNGRTVKSICYSIFVKILFFC